jgi:hypothetical protein
MSVSPLLMTPSVQLAGTQRPPMQAKATSAQSSLSTHTTHWPIPSHTTPAASLHGVCAGASLKSQVPAVQLR